MIMKMYLYRIAIVVFAVAMLAHEGLAQSRLDAIRQELADPHSKNVLVVSHRGDWRNAPENSIQALRRAIAMGVDIIEIDVQLTRDSQLVLMHDRTIDRTTSGKGAVADYTLEELRQFTLRTGSGTPTRQPIPTFEEAMLEVKGHVFVNIDKGFAYFDRVYDVLKQTGTVDQAILKSSLPGEDVNARYGTLLKELIYMPMCNTENEASLASTEAFLGKQPTLMVETNFNNPDKFVAGVRRLEQFPVKIWVNSLWGGIDDELAVDEGDPDASWGWLIARGGRVIQTDRPQELIAYLASKGLRH